MVFISPAFLFFLDFCNLNLTCFDLVSVLTSYVCHCPGSEFLLCSKFHDSTLFLLLLPAYAFPKLPLLGPLRCHRSFWQLSSLSQFPPKICSCKPCHFIWHINLRLNHRHWELGMSKMRVILIALCKYIHLPVSLVTNFKSIKSTNTILNSKCVRDSL